MGRCSVEVSLLPVMGQVSTRIVKLRPVIFQLPTPLLGLSVVATSSVGAPVKKSGRRLYKKQCRSMSNPVKNFCVGGSISFLSRRPLAHSFWRLAILCQAGLSLPLGS